jgi:hypothetical protein
VNSAPGHFNSWTVASRGAAQEYQIHFPAQIQTHQNAKPYATVFPVEGKKWRDYLSGAKPFVESGLQWTCLPCIADMSVSLHGQF